MKKDIYNVTVKKPWGEEFCIHRGNNLSIWLLKILPGQSTSLHCHPKKKTGLVVLAGTADISLLERSFTMTALSKINLRNSIFHKTTNNTSDPLYLVEVESPDDKLDLIRIEDSYGRKDKNFEPETDWITDPPPPFRIDLAKRSSFVGKTFYVSQLASILTDSGISDSSILIILSHYALTAKDNTPLCERGDAITVKTLKFLSSKFNTNLTAEVLVICQN